MNQLRLLAALFLVVSQAHSAPPPLSTISALEVPRYMGTWYEIARYPNRFQEKCTGQSRADYQLQADGTVQVINRCTLASGETQVAVGQARQIGGPTSARLEVRFAPAWLSFIPAVWGDYWVVDIDDDYQWVIVSEPRREFLWLLARQPRLSDERLQSLLLRLQQLEFPTEKLEMTDQYQAAPNTEPRGLQ